MAAGDDRWQMTDNQSSYKQFIDTLPVAIRFI